MVKRSKWTSRHIAAVRGFLRVKRTVAEVYGMLRRRRLIGNLTSRDIRNFLNNSGNYVRKGKKSCPISRRRAQSWVRKPTPLVNLGKPPQPVILNEPLQPVTSGEPQTHASRTVLKYE